MKKLNTEEASGLVIIRHGRETFLSALLKKLTVGEAVVLEAKDWKAGGSPYRVANNIAKRYGWGFEQGRLQDGGWAFKRVK